MTDAIWLSKHFLIDWLTSVWFKPLQHLVRIERCLLVLKKKRNFRKLVCTQFYEQNLASGVLQLNYFEKVPTYRGAKKNKCFFVNKKSCGIICFIGMYSNSKVLEIQNFIFVLHWKRRIVKSYLCRLIGNSKQIMYMF